MARVLNQTSGQDFLPLRLPVSVDCFRREDSLMVHPDRYQIAIQYPIAIWYPYLPPSLLISDSYQLSFRYSIATNGVGMPTIAFVSPKGGAGKTTSAFLLATALAKTYDVTVIDADPNHPIKTWS